MPPVPVRDETATIPQRGDKIALIAGNGLFPRLFAEAARRDGVSVYAIGLIGETAPELADKVDGMVWLRVGQVGRMVRQLKVWKVLFVAMAGGVDKRRLFRRARLDWVGMRLLMSQVLRRDDSLLRALAHQLETSGAKVIASTVFLPEAIAPKGPLTRRRPGKNIERDLTFGLEMARAIGKLDIGQTVAVRSGAVVALEAIEGTDACIHRAGELTGGRGAVVVKVAKPTQDMRFDVPVIGPTTMHSLSQANIRYLGLEAGRTLLLEPQTTLALADQYGICVVGLE